MNGILKGWNKFELAWLSIAITIIVILGFLWDDTMLGMISSIAGILCVVLVAKGKIANYYFGIIQCSTYAYIAYTYGLYGEAMLNALFFLPIQFIGLYMWNKNKKSETDVVNGEDIYIKKLTLEQWLILIPVIIITSFIYMNLLIIINAQQVRLDSIAVILSIVAQFLMIYRYAEQWIMWIIVNVLTIILWLITLITSGNDWTILVMWVAFLINSIYGYMNWIKISKVGEH